MCAAIWHTHTHSHKIQREISSNNLCQQSIQRQLPKGETGREGEEPGGKGQKEKQGAKQKENNRNKEKLRRGGKKEQREERGKESHTTL